MAIISKPQWPIANVVALGETQEGKSTLVKFLADLTPNKDTLMSAIKVGNNTTACTEDSTLYTLNIEDRTFGLRAYGEGPPKSVDNCLAEAMQGKLHRFKGMAGMAEMKFFQHDDHEVSMSESNGTRMTVNLIDTPGLNDTRSAKTPMTDLLHLMGVLEQISKLQGGHLHAIVYVIKYTTSFNGEFLKSIDTYLSNLAPICNKVIVVHSAYDPVAAIKAGNKYLDLSGRIKSLNTLLAEKPYFKQLDMMHLPMNNDLSQVIWEPAQAAFCYQQRDRLLDLIENASQRPTKAIASLDVSKPPILSQLITFINSLTNSKIEGSRRRCATWSCLLQQRKPCRQTRNLAGSQPASRSARTIWLRSITRISCRLTARRSRTRTTFSFRCSSGPSRLKTPCTPSVNSTRRTTIAAGKSKTCTSASCGWRRSLASPTFAVA
ncbi:hypothetical protein AMAG_06659 [Allomyces macrogynus ATCC 38327]|uniref:Uncharacterized protein n=1 Tax=Allomyces macrogynus (strain ATCC 38327) TaxID=578462 RepID=A0A0L0SED7_ALLM3|nr:hypothetical protein AMAG_06659 [Allomyces macrogynus ATCC 38327]|eukprot:KNE60898.1 hypothetical protein AMAG_06659 [Allomyces macrogynus ATCC 38327]